VEAEGVRAGKARGGRDHGARNGWDGESPRAPENAALPPPSCKMQHLLQQQLEPQQCASGLQNADADAAPTAAGDDLSYTPQRRKLVVSSRATPVRPMPLTGQARDTPKTLSFTPTFH
jgi:hypothetical protein